MSEKYPFGEFVDEMDSTAFFNMRGWLEDALVARGAVVTGKGIGGGMADIDFMVDGAPYNVEIRPRQMGDNNQHEPFWLTDPDKPL